MPVISGDGLTQRVAYQFALGLALQNGQLVQDVGYLVMTPQPNQEGISA